MRYSRTKYQTNGTIVNPFDKEAAKKADQNLYQFATGVKGLPPTLVKKTAQYKDMDQSYADKPSLGSYNSYNILEDILKMNKNNQMTQLPDKTIIKSPAGVDGKSKTEEYNTSDYNDRQSFSKSLGKTSGGRSKDLPNYMNEAIPGLWNIESRETDETLGGLGPQGLKMLRDSKRFTEDQLKGITLADANDRSNPAVAYLLDKVADASTKMTGTGNQTSGSKASGDRGVNAMGDPITKAMYESIVIDKQPFHVQKMKEKAIKSGYKGNIDDLVTRLNQVRENAINQKVNVEDPRVFAGWLRDQKILDDDSANSYFQGIQPKGPQTRTDLLMIDSKEEPIENQPKITKRVEEKPGNSIQYSQGLSKNSVKSTPGMFGDAEEILKTSPTEGGGMFGDAISFVKQPQSKPKPYTTPGTSTNTMSGRLQSGASTTNGTRQNITEIETQPKAATMKKYTATPAQYKNGGYMRSKFQLNGQAQVDPFGKYTVPYTPSDTMVRSQQPIDTDPFNQPFIDENIRQSNIDNPIWDNRSNQFNKKYLDKEEYMRQMQMQKEKERLMRQQQLIPKRRPTGQLGGPMSWNQKNTMLKYGR